MRKGRDFIARHAETVFNAAARMHDHDQAHSPLTRAGFAQAEAMGETLAYRLGPGWSPTLWSSPTGRALQTLSVVAEHLGLDWHRAQVDPRLTELDMGAWSGRYFADVIAEVGPVVTPAGHFLQGPGGEDYPAVAARLAGWVADTDADPGDRLVVTHGLSGQILRGLLTGAPVDPGCGAPVRPHLPQGTVVMIEHGTETIVHLGLGAEPE